jgi:creatinine amidohydrolase/Fe(II)-dependent formamide hydrolase-like protein
MRPVLPALALILALPLASQAAAQAAQPDATAVQVGPPPGPPPNVFHEDITWNEMRDAIRMGYTTYIIPTGGVEQNGPHMVLGKHNFIVNYAAERIAKALGNAIVGPVLGYVPEGTWEPKSGHMRYPGTLGLDEAGFQTVLEANALSAKSAGFKNILLIGDSGGNQAGQQAVAEKLSAAWAAEGVKVAHIGDYYAKSSTDANAWIVANLKIPANQVGTHAGIIDTSQLMWVNPAMIRFDKLEAGSATNGIAGDPRAATPAIGQALLQIKIDNALAQIRQLTGLQVAHPAEAKAIYSPYTASSALPNPQGRMTARQTPAPSPAKLPSYFLEELTWTEVRDAMAAGYNTVIVPVGGLEKNAYHMVTGKHGFHARAGALRMAEQLGNALIAPYMQHAPEGQASLNNPTTLSCQNACFEAMFTGAANSLRAHGFANILFVGDNGGAQTPIRTNTERIMAAWGDESPSKVYGLTDFYDKGHVYLENYFLAVYGWNAQQVGSHAGIQDSSQMMWVRPQSVRWDRVALSEQNRQDAGVSGDPTKSTPEFGRIGIEYKAIGALEQFRELSPQPARGGGAGRGGGGGGGGGGGRGGRAGPPPPPPGGF